MCYTMYLYNRRLDYKHNDTSFKKDYVLNCALKFIHVEIRCFAME